MKKVFIFSLVVLNIALATTLKHRLKNKKSNLSFSAESLLGNKEKPTTLDSIFTAKPIGVSTTFSTIGEETKKVESNLSKDQRFKENSKNSNNYELKNLEAPTIVKSLGNEDPFSVPNRVAERSPQTMSNRQAYDLIYPSHKDYYKDKQYVVIDKNFKQTEDYLLNQFKSAIDSAIEYSQNSKLEHVDNFDKSKINLRGMNLQNSAPFIHPQAVTTSMNYDLKDQNVQITTSDPYKTIFSL